MDAAHVTSMAVVFGGGTQLSDGPMGVAVDGADNIVVADTENHRICKISRDGTVTTLAGSGNPGFADGQLGAASFHCPCRVAVDSADNIFVSDFWNGRIRKISRDGIVTTLAGEFYAIGLAVDSAGNILIADEGSRIGMITAHGTVGTLGVAAEFHHVYDVALDSIGNIYVADTDRICKISRDGAVTTLAGSGNRGFDNGQGDAANFFKAEGVAVDSADNIYFVDTVNNRICKISQDGTVTTLAGSGDRGFVDGQGGAARFSNPSGVAVDSAGNILVADVGNHCIRKIVTGLARAQALHELICLKALYANRRAGLKLQHPVSLLEDGSMLYGPLSSPTEFQMVLRSLLGLPRDVIQQIVLLLL
eukprot:NODE_8674_length_1477_cov_7.340000.p1 GENE.NODE_8674_length_1477_cov_7.340000~~NODE_8674_length_1477_cov_7.340000.p1  ORF type:complete len:363 (-),score=18.95 NODE_8674_length_1477_cov_7.340000:299-1387(-)